MGGKPRSSRALLRDRRVHIRRPGPADLDALVELAAVSRKLHGRYASPPTDRAEFGAYLGANDSGRNRALWVFRNDDHVLLGVFNLSQIIRGPLQQAFLGYYGNASTAGHGYMLEGLRLVLEHAFSSMGLHRLEANIEPPNHVSKRLVERAGFRVEGFSPRYLQIAGRWRDCERWAITREEWRATSGLRG
ncbi:MAG: GNAT family N-acetyltransferase [Deltaproteobacteria bacterium]|jgi:ribosomal-protein-alanine N-acetyltransferase|nr:GNAT family N-acetyltransferase [Deltaproteobacteria bacterium]